ncbi:hypothetical protein [Leptolyngbya sp. PCC 6406]|uniref:hypothetical protein n=1 Tax=Leptolyngbya sp. PCC 6406 TaxID=1173264 RepID=UPI0002AC75B9|nr:hypothetical protein [Leptolyngbya sp. PCC 6406]
MADPTPPPENVSNLPSKPLGVLQPLSNLGLRLQRTTLLGERFLGVLDPDLRSPLGTPAPDSGTDGVNDSGDEGTEEISPEAWVAASTDQPDSDLGASIAANTAGETVQRQPEPTVPTRRRRDHPGSLTDITPFLPETPPPPPAPPLQRQPLVSPVPPQSPTLQSSTLRPLRRPDSPARPGQMPPRAQRQHPGTLASIPGLPPPPAPSPPDLQAVPAEPAALPGEQNASQASPGVGSAHILQASPSPASASAPEPSVLSGSATPSSPESQLEASPSPAVESIPASSELQVSSGEEDFAPTESLLQASSSVEPGGVEGSPPVPSLPVSPSPSPQGVSENAEVSPPEPLQASLSSAQLPPTDQPSPTADRPQISSKGAAESLNRQAVPEASPLSTGEDSSFAVGSAHPTAISMAESGPSSGTGAEESGPPGIQAASAVGSAHPTESDVMSASQDSSTSAAPSSSGSLPQTTPESTAAPSLPQGSAISAADSSILQASPSPAVESVPQLQASPSPASASAPEPSVSSGSATQSSPESQLQAFPSPTAEAAPASSELQVSPGEEDFVPTESLLQASSSVESGGVEASPPVPSLPVSPSPSPQGVTENAELSPPEPLEASLSSAQLPPTDQPSPTADRPQISSQGAAESLNRQAVPEASPLSTGTDSSLSDVVGSAHPTAISMTESGPSSGTGAEESDPPGIQAASVVGSAHPTERDVMSVSGSSGTGAEESGPPGIQAASVVGSAHPTGGDVVEFGSASQLQADSDSAATLAAAPPNLPEVSPGETAESSPGSMGQTAPSPAVESSPGSLGQAAPSPAMESAPESLLQAAPVPEVTPSPESLVQAAPSPSVESAPESLIQAAPAPVVESSSSQVSSNSVATPLPGSPLQASPDAGAQLPTLQSPSSPAAIPVPEPADPQADSGAGGALLQASPNLDFAGTELSPSAKSPAVSPSPFPQSVTGEADVSAIPSPDGTRAPEILPASPSSGQLPPTDQTFPTTDRPQISPEGDVGILNRQVAPEASPSSSIGMDSLATTSSPFPESPTSSPSFDITNPSAEVRWAASRAPIPNPPPPLPSDIPSNIPESAAIGDSVAPLSNRSTGYPADIAEISEVSSPETVARQVAPDGVPGLTPEAQSPAPAPIPDTLAAPILDSAPAAPTETTPESGSIPTPEVPSESVLSNEPAEGTATVAQGARPDDNADTAITAADTSYPLPTVLQALSVLQPLSPTLGNSLQRTLEEDRDLQWPEAGQRPSQLSPETAYTPVTTARSTQPSPPVPSLVGAAGKVAQSPSLLQAQSDPTAPTDPPPTRDRKTTTLPPTVWGSIEELISGTGDSGESPSPPPSVSPADPYPDLQPLAALRQSTASSGDTLTLQRKLESTPTATPTASTIEPENSNEDQATSGASPETLDKLVQQVYHLICQRLAVERERHGFGPRY